MKTRTRENFPEKEQVFTPQDASFDPIVFLIKGIIVFLFYLLIMVGIESILYYTLPELNWIVLKNSVWIFFLLVCIRWYKVRRKYSFKERYFDSTEHEDLDNILNHQKYYDTSYIQNDLKKMLWKEIYFPKYMESLQIFVLTFPYFMVVWWLWSNTSFFDYLDLLGIFWAIIWFSLIIIPVFACVYIAIKNRLKYKRILNDARNRYFIKNIFSKYYYFDNLTNTEWWEDYIFTRRM